MACDRCGATDREISDANKRGDARFSVPCGCDTHGDHAGCNAICLTFGCRGGFEPCDHTIKKTAKFYVDAKTGEWGMQKDLRLVDLVDLADVLEDAVKDRKTLIRRLRHLARSKGERL